MWYTLLCNKALDRYVGESVPSFLSSGHASTLFKMHGSLSMIDDETLMAYADSELSEEEGKKVELALKDDPKGRDRLEDFKITGAAISQYMAILEEPVPNNLKDFVKAMGW